MQTHAHIHTHTLNRGFNMGGLRSSFKIPLAPAEISPRSEDLRRRICGRSASLTTGLESTTESSNVAASTNDDNMLVICILKVYSMRTTQCRNSAVLNARNCDCQFAFVSRFYTPQCLVCVYASASAHAQFKGEGLSFFLKKL